MLNKIKEFFRNLFKGYSYKCLEETKEQKVSKDTKNEFDLSSQVAEDIEAKDRIQVLYQDFSDGKIKEEDLSQNERKILIKYYLEKINETKQSINTYKEKIEIIKSKMNNK